MDANLLLQWHYMIFLLPFGISALMLLVSSLRLGGHRHGHTSGGQGHSHASGAAHAPRFAHNATARHHTPSHARPTTHSRHNGARQRDALHSANPLSLFVGIFGIGRAPLPLMLEAFGLVWGIAGCLANQLLLKTPAPNLAQMFPSLGIALVSGLVGARLSAEAFARIMPQDETQVVSRDSLFGLVGSVAFPISATTGRIHIYDEHGTLHDETCRTPQDHPPIEKGKKVMVVDMDTQGRLIVEEVPGDVR